MSLGTKHGQKPLEAMAMWMATLCAILLAPQVWSASGWLGERLLQPEFGYQIAYYLRFAVFACLFMAGLYAARVTLVSSVGIIALAVLTKIPL